MAVRDRFVSAEEFAETARAAAAQGEPLRVSIGNISYEVESELANVLLSLLEVVRDGVHLDINTLPAELSTGQAADLLGVSRPTVVKLVDDGKLSASRIGTHRRIPTVELLAFRQRSRHGRRSALNELVALSDELGLYTD